MSFETNYFFFWPKLHHCINSHYTKDAVYAVIKILDGQLSIPGEVHLETDASVKPLVLAPRRLPHAMKLRVKKELNNLVEKEVIAKVPPEEPAQWVSQLVVADKKDGSFRICIDHRPLNEALRRVHYQLPNLDDILPDLA